MHECIKFLECICIFNFKCTCTISNDGHVYYRAVSLLPQTRVQGLPTFTVTKKDGFTEIKREDTVLQT